MSRPLKGILLDLDNTLYDYEPCHAHALKKCHEFFRKNVLPIGFETFSTLYLKGRDAVKKNNRHTVGSRSRHLYFQLMLEHMRGQTDTKNSLRLGDIYWESFLRKMTVRPWVLPFLKDARARGITIVVVTNLESSLQYKKLARLGITDLIDFVVTSEEAGVEKPHPKMYKMALDKTGLRPKDVVMLGDDQTLDGAGAKNAGIPFLLCG